MNRIRIRDVQNATAIVMDVPRKDIIGSSRFAHIVRARQIAMVMSRKLTDRSLLEIANQFGGKDHSTVIHALKKSDRVITKEQADAIAAHARRLADGFWGSFKGGTSGRNLVHRAGIAGSRVDRSGSHHQAGL